MGLISAVCTIIYCTVLWCPILAKVKGHLFNTHLELNSTNLDHKHLPWSQSRVNHTSWTPKLILHQTGKSCRVQAHSGLLAIKHLPLQRDIAVRKCLDIRTTKRGQAWASRCFQSHALCAKNTLRTLFWIKPKFSHLWQDCKPADLHWDLFPKQFKLLPSTVFLEKHDMLVSIPGTITAPHQDKIACAGILVIIKGAKLFITWPLTPTIAKPCLA